VANHARKQSAAGVSSPDVVAISWHLSRAAGRRISAELAAEGFGDLQTSHGALLYWLSAGLTRVTDISQRLALTRQAVSLMADQLEACGYAERTVDPADRRARMVLLTERGKAAAACVNRVHTQMHERWAEVLGAERMREFRRMLENIASALDGSASAMGGSGLG
jgi:DNA-binding MarR family transcriptional regulator